MSLKKVYPLLAAALLMACGDTIEKVDQTGVEVFASEDDLPKCIDKNEGDLVFVKDEDATRICVAGKWKPASPGSTDDFSCKTVELKDKSGLKIVCNGDSIGVVLNGSDGKSNTGCEISEMTDTTVVLVCDDTTKTIRLGGLPADTLVPDSEKVAISLDSLVGFTQKGPFLKGSTVYLYELSDGRTLKQTNGNFTSKITRDDGRYKFTARDLVSQYAMVVVDGYYRNEVTGDASGASIRLSALTDMRKRTSVNVNLLTHMEFDRVYHLVTRGDSTGKKLTVKQAKRQAQKEILEQFHIALAENTDAEDMDVFGSTDADAALLAVSILLQRDDNETALSVLLTEISNDIAETGKWNDSATKARIADWAMMADVGDTSRLDTFRSNVDGWHLGDTVPGFEKFLRNFVAKQNGLGVCGSADVKAGTVKNVTNPKSGYYAKSYENVKGPGKKTRFICKKEDGVARWHIASDIEKDTYLWKPDSDGAILPGTITGKNYLYDSVDGNWRATYMEEDSLGGCTIAREKSCSVGLVTKNGEKQGYVCGSRMWVNYDNRTVDTKCWGDTTDGALREGITGIYYKYDEQEGQWLEADVQDTELGFGGCTAKRKGEVKLEARSYMDVYWICRENGMWDKATVPEYDTYGLVCTADSAGKIVRGQVDATNRYFCTAAAGWMWLQAGWSWEVPRDAYLSPDITYGTMTDGRDRQTYKTVDIGSQTWMAQNLNYYKDDFAETSLCFDENPDYCDVGGRLYQWDAAMQACPTGWHLPTVDEWRTLITTVGGDTTETGVPVASLVLRTQIGWQDGNNGTDAFGFSALPAGYLEGQYSNGAGFWSSTENEFDAFYAYPVTMTNDTKECVHGSGGNPKSWSMSVRCVKD